MGDKVPIALYVRGGWRSVVLRGFARFADMSLGERWDGGGGSNLLFYKYRKVVKIY